MFHVFETFSCKIGDPHAFIGSGTKVAENFSIITQQTIVLMKTFSKRLDQDEYIRFTDASSEDVFKTSWSRPMYSSWSYVFKTFSRLLQDVLSRHLQNIFNTSSRRFQDVFKTSSRHLQDVLLRRFQNIFKTSSWRFQHVFKTSSSYSQDVLQRCLQDVFKTYHQVKLFLLTRFQDVFETYSKRFWDVLQRRLSIEGFA